MSNSLITFHNSMEETNSAAKKEIIHTDIVLDIGCGLRPLSLFIPKVHLAIEPYQQYHQLLQKRFATIPSFVLLNMMVPEGLRVFPDDSVDSVFMLDLIEHLEKENGLRLLAEAERLARRQIVVFTPLGFMEQSYNESETDSWGFHNTLLQTHRSGWRPEELGPGWVAHACKTYHRHSKTGEAFGAFYAVKTFHAAAESVGEHG